MNRAGHGYAEILGIVTSGLRAHGGSALLVMALGVMGTACQILGLLCLLPILRSASAGEMLTDGGVAWMPEHWGQTQATLLLIAVSTVLLLISVRLRNETYHRSRVVAVEHAIACANECVSLLVRRHRNLADADEPTRRVINRVFPATPNALALLLFNALLGLNEAVLILPLVATLTWFAPVFGLGSILISLPFVAAFLYKLRHNTDRVIKQVERRQSMRHELDSLYEAVVQAAGDRRIEPPVLGEGSAHRELVDVLHSGIELKGRIRTTSLSMDYIGPLVVLTFGLLFVYSETLDLDLAELFVGFLLMRQMLSSMIRIADSLVVVNRVYMGLSEYMDLKRTNHQQSE